MGFVIVPAILENLADGALARRGLLPAGQVRRVEVMDALIDPNVPGLLLPAWVVVALGLEPLRPQPPYTTQVGRTVRLTVDGRDCVMDVGEVADDSPVVIGRIPLLATDWVIEPQGERLIGNPDHGGEWRMEVPHAEELK